MEVGAPLYARQCTKKEKTRSARGPNGFSRSRGETKYPNLPFSLNFSLKILSGDKLYRFRFRYSNLLQRLWIYSLSRLPLHHLERPETDELNHLVFLYTRLN